MVELEWTGNINYDHHGYLIEGNHNTVELLVEFLKNKWKVESIGNPDFHVENYSSLTITNSRSLSDSQSKKSFSGGYKIYIMTFDSATREAQNSLLKVLEEPAVKTYFFLIVPRVEILLTTLRSRLNFVGTAEHRFVSEVNTLSEKFLSGNQKERVIIADQLAEDVADEKINRQFIADIIDQIEKYTWQRSQSVGTSRRNVFDDIAMVKKFITDHSSSVKLLLEHLALVLTND